jgi:hypothetical protein
LIEKITGNLPVFVRPLDQARMGWFVIGNHHKLWVSPVERSFEIPLLPEPGRLVFRCYALP